MYVVTGFADWNEVMPDENGNVNNTEATFTCTPSKIEFTSVSGQGISDKDMPHIFERFYKSDNSRNSNSFGLGLAIARAAFSLASSDRISG